MVPVCPCGGLSDTRLTEAMKTLVIIVQKGAPEKPPWQSIWPSAPCAADYVLRFSTSTRRRPHLPGTSVGHLTESCMLCGQAQLILGNCWPRPMPLVSTSPSSTQHRILNHVHFENS